MGDYDSRIEAAAKAAYESDPFNGLWANADEVERMAWRILARAAISAFCAGAARVENPTGNRIRIETKPGSYLWLGAGRWIFLPAPPEDEAHGASDEALECFKEGR
jgi:hypothetical protein